MNWLLNTELHARVSFSALCSYVVPFLAGYPWFLPTKGDWKGGRMEGEGHHGVVLACSICGFLFAVLSPFSFWVLWAVNWRPWRLYRYAAEVLYLSLSGSTNILLFLLSAISFVFCRFSLKLHAFFCTIDYHKQSRKPIFCFCIRDIRSLLPIFICSLLQGLYL